MPTKMTREDHEAAFHRTIDDDPLNPVPRLVYADWLDEEGHRDAAKDHRFVARALGRYADEKSEWDKASLRDLLPHQEYDGMDRHHWLFDHTGRDPFPNLAIRSRVLGDRHVQNADEAPDEEYPEWDKPTHRFHHDGTDYEVFSDGSAVISGNGSTTTDHDIAGGDWGQQFWHEIAQNELHHHHENGHWDNDELARFLIEHRLMDDPEGEEE